MKNRLRKLMAIALVFALMLGLMPTQSVMVVKAADLDDNAAAIATALASVFSVDDKVYDGVVAAVGDNFGTLKLTEALGLTDAEHDVSV